MKYFLIIPLLFWVNISAATTRYVTTTGAGTFTGLSWQNAAPASGLQLMIDNAVSGDQVWVACGTYVVTATTNRSLSFHMRNNVEVYGSFQGTETTLSQRNLSCGPCSVLSGEIGGPGINDNSFHVVSNGNLSPAAVLDGFVVSGGNDDRANTLNEGLGGGIYNQGANVGNNSSPTIRNCVITNNRAVFGGGIFNNGYNGGVSSPVISHCIITNNTAIDGGGGIDNFGLAGNASPSIVNSLIINNTAPTAGGIYCWGGNPGGNSSPSLLNCVIANNSATGGNAGGLIADNSNSFNLQNSGTSNVQIRNCIFRNNTAAMAGPQFAIKGTATFNATYSSIDLTSQLFPHVISGAGTGNISSDPQFVNANDPNGNDNCWMTADDGLNISSSSTCVDAGNNPGTPAMDLRFMNRIYNSVVDIGAYEFNPLSLAVAFLAFDAREVGAGIQLSWLMEDEKPDHYFKIERSINGFNFDSIGIIGIITDNASMGYRYIDSESRSTSNYYRLTYQNHEGKLSLRSRIVFVHSRTSTSL
ncbi:MAG: hypothetical protein H7Y31_18640 [Chitinophagaceae bacterium]|nr:hypothetical protein [Chitinophagaceae bacterium]